jgi:hypothetical protein
MAPAGSILGDSERVRPAKYRHIEAKCGSLANQLANMNQNI